MRLQLHKGAHCRHTTYYPRISAGLTKLSLTQCKPAILSTLQIIFLFFAGKTSATRYLSRFIYRIPEFGSSDLGHFMEPDTSGAVTVIPAVPMCSIPRHTSTVNSHETQMVFDIIQREVVDFRHHFLSGAILMTYLFLVTVFSII